MSKHHLYQGLFIKYYEYTWKWGIMVDSLLTLREKEIFSLLVKNNSTKDVSKCLHISEKTVRNHISNVIQKLDCKNRSCALVELIKLGEISI